MPLLVGDKSKGFVWWKPDKRYGQVVSPTFHSPNVAQAWLHTKATFVVSWRPHENTEYKAVMGHDAAFSLYQMLRSQNSNVVLIQD